MENTPLGTARDAIAGYSASTDAQRLLMALWAAHTHVYRLFGVSPRLSFSGEAGSGKTTTMEIVVAMSSNPLQNVVYISQAALYSYLDENPDTTIGMDEMDLAFGETGRTTTRGIMQAVLDGGYRANTYTIVMRGNKPVKMNIFAPVALAGIGVLPHALAQRSVRIKLERQQPDNIYMPETDEGLLAEIGQDLRSWLQTTRFLRFVSEQPRLADVDGDPRQRAILAPLQTIAAYAGAKSLFQEAWSEIRSELKDDPDELESELIIPDVLSVWPDTGTAMMSGPEILDALSRAQEPRWRYLWQSSVGPRMLAGLLRQNGVESRVSGGKRGYLLSDIAHTTEETEVTDKRDNLKRGTA